MRSAATVSSSKRAGSGSFSTSACLCRHRIPTRRFCQASRAYWAACLASRDRALARASRPLRARRPRRRGRPDLRRQSDRADPARGCILHAQRRRSSASRGTQAERPLQLGRFTVTPYLVDHSAFDAYALLVEADRRRLFYSGDLRSHGRKQRTMERLFRSPPTDVDVLLMEGTTVGRSANFDPVLARMPLKMPPAACSSTRTVSRFACSRPRTSTGSSAFSEPRSARGGRSCSPSTQPPSHERRPGPAPSPSRSGPRSCVPPWCPAAEGDRDPGVRTRR